MDQSNVLQELCSIRELLAANLALLPNRFLNLHWLYLHLEYQLRLLKFLSFPSLKLLVLSTEVLQDASHQVDLR